MKLATERHSWLVAQLPQLPMSAHPIEEATGFGNVDVSAHLILAPFGV